MAAQRLLPSFVTINIWFAGTSPHSDVEIRSLGSGGMNVMFPSPRMTAIGAGRSAHLVSLLHDIVMQPDPVGQFAPATQSLLVGQ